MRYLPFIVIGLLCLPAPAPAADRDEEECEAVKEKIRKVQSKMRSGYSAKEGVKLNARLLELRRKRAKVCD